ncbi:MAG: hypothetical protein RLZZ324_163 [Candidatus Parcubacteria bacterium]|jgi:subtilase family serine protease
MTRSLISLVGAGTLLAAFAFAGCAEAHEDGDVPAAVEALKGDPGLDIFIAHPPHHVREDATTSPTGLSPTKVRVAYGLPATGGSGTIAIVDAYDNPNAEADLRVFSTQFGLPQCTTANGCFKKVMVGGKVRGDSGWGLEIALDVQWAHAIAPNAKILLVEAKSASGTDLLNAVNYARNQPDVVAVSMSWGGGEFSGEASYDQYFTSVYGATFFASSGDNGTGASWPASSPNIVAVGGTRLAFNADGTLASETAWSGSGGGVSAYQPMPAFQTALGLTGGKRLIPDVSFDADPASGVSVYDSYSYNGQRGWFAVGGTSAGAPQWAAIKSLGLSASNAFFYQDAAGASAATFFRDITSGTNGSCGAVCTAATGYDTVTGVGSPLKTVF